MKVTKESGYLQQSDGSYSDLEIFKFETSTPLSSHEIELHHNLSNGEWTGQEIGPDGWRDLDNEEVQEYLRYLGAPRVKG